MDRKEFSGRLRGLNGKTPSDKLYEISAMMTSINAEFSWGRINENDMLHFIDTLGFEIGNIAEEVESIEKW